MKAWSFLTLWSGLLTLWIFSAVPQYFEYAERSHFLPAALNGQFVLRNDSMGKGYFGASRSNGRHHNGIDLQSTLGAPVGASKSGRVVFAGTEGGYGNYIRLEHPDGTNTRYAHLSEMRVKPGQWVWRKQIIGAIGNTGNADHPAILPHLHYEIRRQEEPIDPTFLLQPDSGAGGSSWDG